MQTPAILQMFLRKWRINRWSKRRHEHQVRLATPNDLPGLLRVERSAWEDTNALAFGEKEMKAQLEKYPTGTLLAERLSPNGNTIVALASLMRVSEAMFARIRDEPCSWEDITSSGFIRNHDPNGPYLYGVNLSVTIRAERMGIGNTIRAQIGAKVVQEGLRGIIFEGRLPKLQEFNDARKTAGNPPVDGHTYVELKDPRGKPLDPELRDYLETPFMRVLAVKPNFFQDPGSENWGVLLFWPNPLYHLGCGFLYRFRPLSSPLINLAARMVGLGV